MRSLRSPLLAVLIVAACSTDEEAPRPNPGDSLVEPGNKVTTTLSAEDQAALDEITAEAKASASMTAGAFASKYAVAFRPLGYDPKTAANWALVAKSSFKPNDAEAAALAKNGFVVQSTHRFPAFTYGYKTIYLEDLPVFVSADSVLFAIHRSYDAILKDIEGAVLIGELRALLVDMRDALAKGGAPELAGEARTDADVYLAVALSLVDGALAPPVAGGSASNIKSLYEGALAHAGTQTLQLFGGVREVDFSQFTPRGHYTSSDALKQYFRASMWLGRIDFRILDTQPDGSQLFRRRQLETALGLRALMGDSKAGPASAVARWSRIDATIRAFVGEPDMMTPKDVDPLFAALGITSLGQLGKLSDAAIASTIVKGRFGTQRISSHIMINGLGQGTLPLSSSFALLPQRYVIDSHVFSNVVYDRVAHGTVYRMMPSTFDVAFAALKNDHAGALLAPELARWGYAPDLHMMRFVADKHGDAFWTANLYNLWLSALRELSPNASEIADPAKAGLPTIAATEAWGRRILQTQLASWAELRHDTILYAKQSYTSGAACTFPDAYVDPYPGFFAKVSDLATRGRTLVAALDFSAQPALGAKIDGYFQRLGTVADTLGAMARNEREGKPITDEQLKFINRAVSKSEVCGSTDTTGWYADLFYAVDTSSQLDPTIADVHTQPTDEGGAPVGKVLHVATGLPRSIVLTVDQPGSDCTAPRAYVGVVSSYHEKITGDFQRLTDEEWQKEVYAATDVPWIAPLVSGK